MLGDGLYCIVEFANEGRDFYINGDVIRGNLVLNAAHRTNLVSKITGSLICEEWVHTTQLEFKEHFHSNVKIFDVQRNPIELEPGHPASIPFTLDVPKDENLRLPPSFDLKHNNVVWKVKFSIEYKAAHAGSEAGIAQEEQRIRLCRYSEKFKPNLEDHAVSSYEWSAVRSDFTIPQGHYGNILDKGETAVDGLGDFVSRTLHRPKHQQKPAVVTADLDELQVKLLLDVPGYGLIQTPLPNGPKLGLRLTLETQFPGLQLTEIALDIVKYVLTAGKDPYEEVKPVIRLREVCALKPGSNDLTKYLSRVTLSGLTETFKTEWQQLAQKLRITLSFIVDGDAKHALKLTWAVPVNVVSEAYGLTM